MITVLAVVLAALLAVFLLALADVPLFGLLLRITWPLRWLLDRRQVRIAMREFDREYAKLTHPSAR